MITSEDMVTGNEQPGRQLAATQIEGLALLTSHNRTSERNLKINVPHVQEMEEGRESVTQEQNISRKESTNLKKNQMAWTEL